MARVEDDGPMPLSDKVEGAPHPRDSLRLFGQDAAQRDFLDAFNSGRMHHGWMLTGPRGVGKATLAWRIARFLLTRPLGGGGADMFGAPPPPASLDVDPEHPVTRRIAAGSESGLFVLRKQWDEKSKKFRQQIGVDEVRKLKSFFALSATDGGRRVVIVDAADDLNVNAANALLKLLEEPPAGATLLLVAHQPSRLLPTIRSRCRTLRLPALSTEATAAALQQAGIETGDDRAALAELSAGSVGEAVRLATGGGLKLYADLIALFASMPRTDRARALALANSVAAPTAAAKLDLLLDLLDLVLARLARTGATGLPPATEAAPGERDILARLAPTPAAARAWADLAQSQGARMRHGRAVNLDPAALILDTVFKLQEAAH